MKSIPKDPDAVLDYRFDWTAWLNDSENITSAQVDVPAGMVKGSTAFAAGTVTVWLSGGTAGLRYSVTCRIVTDQGRTDDRTLLIDVQDR